MQDLWCAVPLGQVFFPVLLRFFPVSIIPPVPHPRLPHKSTLARWTKERTLETLKKICSFGNRGGGGGKWAKRRLHCSALSASVALTHTALGPSVLLTHLQSGSCSSLQIPCTRSPCPPSAGCLTVLMAQTRLLIARISGDTVTPFVIGSLLQEGPLKCMGNCREGKAEVLNPVRLKK